MTSLSSCVVSMVRYILVMDQMASANCGDWD